jgi:hypothetical protein
MAAGYARRTEFTQSGVHYHRTSTIDKKFSDSYKYIAMIHTNLSRNGEQLTTVPFRLADYYYYYFTPRGRVCRG